MPPIYLVPPSRAKLEDQINRETQTVSSAQCQSTGYTDTSRACKGNEIHRKAGGKKFTSVFSYTLLLTVHIRNSFTIYR